MAEYVDEYAEVGAFVCGEHPRRRYFKTFGELEEHRHAEHTVRAAKTCGDLMPSDPLIVMPGLGSLSPEKRAEIDRLWTVVRGSGQQMLGAFPSTESTANDGRALLSGALPVEPCACCGAQPPKHENLDACDVTGWALFSFPIEAATPTPLRAALMAREAKRLCPPCGEKVAKFIAHLSTPMLHEEDLL